MSISMLPHQNFSSESQCLHFVLKCRALGSVQHIRLWLFKQRLSCSTSEYGRQWQIHSARSHRNIIMSQTLSGGPGLVFPAMLFNFLLGFVQCVHKHRACFAVLTAGHAIFIFSNLLTFSRLFHMNSAAGVLLRRL